MSDWKGDKPPHETVCGNPAADPGAGPEAGFSSSFSFLKSIKENGEPYRGCVPTEYQALETSPALEHQLALLTNPPYPDYVVRIFFPFTKNKHLFTALHRQLIDSESNRKASIHADMLDITGRIFQSVRLSNAEIDLFRSYVVLSVSQSR